MNVNKQSINLPAFEAHTASICVALVSGFVAGKLSIALYNFSASYAQLNNGVLYCLIAFLGFAIPWVVCKYVFHTAHHWYGAKSLAHRMYDSLGVIAAFSALWW